MSNKSKPAKRQSKGVSGDGCRVTRKAKPVGRASSRAAGNVTRDKKDIPLYRKPPPKSKAVASAVPSRKNSREDTRHYISHPHLLAPAHFELREDGTIGTPASGTARSQQAQNAVLEAGAPPSTAPRMPSGLNSQPSTMPPRLAFTDPARGIWLYHGNSLELLDAIFADPPYFLSNGGIIPQSGTK